MAEKTLPTIACVIETKKLYETEGGRRFAVNCKRMRAGSCRLCLEPATGKRLGVWDKIRALMPRRRVLGSAGD